MRRDILQIGIIAAAFTLSLPDAYAKPAEPEPDGIQAGGFVLHPGGDFGLSFDIEDTRGEDHKDGLVDIGAHFKTRLVDQETKSWDNWIGLRWRQYWGVGDAKANGGINVNVNTNADLFKKSIFRLSPSASYDYVTDPDDENLRQDYKNHNVGAGVAFTIQPGEGAIFAERIAYNFNGHLYEDRSDISHFTHRIESLTRWNFLPQTSMTLLADFRITHFLEDTRGSSTNDGGGSENSTSYPIRIKYGMQGLILDRLSYELGLGYAYVYYTNSLKEHMFIMNAKLKYEPTTYSFVSLEYRKDFNNAVYGNYYKYHRIMLDCGALWFEHLKTDLELGYGHFNFKSLEDDSRSDDFISAQAKIYYFFFPGMKLGIEYRLRYNLSNVELADYNRHLITLNFGYEY